MQQTLRNILHLCAGDFPAKALNFLTFVYLARVLGVMNYGVLEFALSILTYFLLLADGGLELWATREAARGSDMQQVAARVVPLRLLMALGSSTMLLLVLPALPDYPALTIVLVLFGLTLFGQAVNVKWAFMGSEKMKRVAAGLVMGQVVFAAAVFGFVHSPEQIVWVPVFRLLADVVMAMYFLRLFAATYGGLPWPLTLRGASTVVRPALALGGSQAVGLLSFNFDSVLLGVMSGPMAVGLYNAAYKPVTAALAMPVTYYVGLFPALSRSYAASKEEFREIVVSSLRLTSFFALPLGIMGTFFSSQIVHLLFGPSYAEAIPALQILSWSAVLATLRGTFKHGLNAAGRAGLDLRSGAMAVAVNVTLNFLLIPRYGIIGAAAATVAAEVLWLITVAWCFNRFIMRVNCLGALMAPLAACGVMASCLMALQPWFWGLQLSLGVAAYVGTLLLLNGTDIPGLKVGSPAGARGE